MTTPRIYIPPDLCLLDSLEITGNNYHYLVRVFRVKRGHKIVLLDGQGTKCEGWVEELGKNYVRIRVALREREEMEVPRFHLFQAIPQGRKMEEVIRRTVELGIHALRPFKSSRTLLPVREERHERWEKVGMEASRTAGRAYLPLIMPILTWEDLLAEIGRMSLVLLADEMEGMRVEEALGRMTPEDVGLLVGPEGGFSLREKEEMVSAGALPVSLGKNILRTESAGAVLLTLVRHHYGFL